MSDAYAPVLKKLMTFVNNEDYPDNYVFSNEELGALTPTSVMLWFNDRMFGDSEPRVGHNMTPLWRSSAAEFWKKAISFFMPNKMMPWNVLSGAGNPTRCNELNSMLKYIRKKEVRGEGAPSKARRSIKLAEFRRVIEILKAEGKDIVWKFGIPAMMAIQFHLISRIDDTTQMKRVNLEVHDSFLFLLKTKLNWAKNCMTEKDAPWQVLLGAIESVFCVHISLALWLELDIDEIPTSGATPYIFAFSDDTKVPDGGKKAKSKVQGIYSSTIFKRPEFDETGCLGSHSTRKLGSSHCRKCGATKDEKDIRGRWKSSKRVSDVYDDVELPYPDAKVAAMNCIGGPCKYVLRDDSGVDRDFILEHVTPRIRSVFGDNVAAVLGTALLWYAFTTEGEQDIPQNLQQRITHAYSNIPGCLQVGVSPVRKVPIIVSGNEGEVYMDELPSSEAGINTPGTGAGGCAFVDRPIRNQMLALHSQMHGIREATNNLREEIQHDRANSRRQYQTMISNIRRVALQPARRVTSSSVRTSNPAAETPTAGPDISEERPPTATLSTTPKDLYLLWEEFQNGIEGRKAAKLFTPNERGKVKHKYVRRKVLWDRVAHLVRSGINSNVAIDRIYRVYGENSTVTSVINRMRIDRNNKTLHPSLR